MQLYESLSVTESVHRFAAAVHLAPEAPGLTGFMCANSVHEGCLVTGAGEQPDAHIRIHSCDNGTSHCPAMRDASVVWIRPILSRLSDGRELAEPAMREPARKPGEKRKPTRAIITFPYSRHSSYPELCHLLSELRPKDVWPCTANPDRWLHSGNSTLPQLLLGACLGLISVRELFWQAPS